MKSGSEVNFFNLKNDTLLIRAITHNNLDLVKFLVTSGADINLDCDFEKLLLSIAITYADLDMFKFLLNSGVDINKTNNGPTFEFLARQAGKLDLYFYLAATFD